MNEVRTVIKTVIIVCPMVHFHRNNKLIMFLQSKANLASKLSIYSDIFGISKLFPNRYSQILDQINMVVVQ